MNDAIDYLLGEMDPERAADFERALADATPRCARRSRRCVRSSRGSSAARPRLGRGRAAAAALPRSCRSRRAARARRRLVLRPAVAALCALALLAAGIGLGVLLDRDPEPRDARSS